jgi:uncharacterized protein YukE
MAPSKGFRVDPDALLDVARQVHDLLEDVSGGSGYVAGNLPRYRDKAGPQVLTEALSSFWSGEDVFATAYGEEHDGIVSTMNAMVGQLTALESACRNTAAQYRSHDKTSKHEVKATEPGAAW